MRGKNSDEKAKKRVSSSVVRLLLPNLKGGGRVPTPEKERG